MTVRRMRTERRRARAAAYERRAAGAHVQRKGARDLLLLAQSLKDGHELGEVFVGFIACVRCFVGGNKVHGIGSEKNIVRHREPWELSIDVPEQYANIVAPLRMGGGAQRKWR